MSTLQGKVFAGYQILDHLGEGGMGTVYRARQLSLDRIVALKILRHEFTRTESAVLRFRRETRIHVQLSHPGVVTVFDCGVVEGTAYIAMELIEGRSLARALESRKTLPVDFAILLGVSVAEVLTYLHGHGVIHRDLKPANLLVSSGTTIKVADFGLSRRDDETLVTEDRALLGTLAYMPPEVLDGAPSSQSADVYALGLILLEVLTTMKTWNESCEVARKKVGRPTVVLRTHRRGPGADPSIVPVGGS